jgi:hypothetical protein
VGFVFFVVLHRNLKILLALGATSTNAIAAEFDFEYREELYFDSQCIGAYNLSCNLRLRTEKARLTNQNNEEC